MRRRDFPLSFRLPSRLRLIPRSSIAQSYIPRVIISANNFSTVRHENLQRFGERERSYWLAIMNNIINISVSHNGAISRNESGRITA